MERSIHHKSLTASNGREHHISFHTYRLSVDEAKFVMDHPKGRLINLIPYPANYQNVPSYFEITFGINSHRVNAQEKMTTTLNEILEEYRILNQQIL